MRYRFRKLIECPDADPPLCVTLEITYRLTPLAIANPYGPDDIFQAVDDWRWVVVAVQGPVGQYHQPDAFAAAHQIVVDLPALDAMIRDYCCEDYAQREMGRDRLVRERSA